MRKRLPLRDRIAVHRAVRRMDKKAKNETRLAAQVEPAVRKWQDDLKSGRRDW